MTFRVWIHGIAAAAVSAFVTAITGVVALPTVFTFDKTGLVNAVKMSVPPTILAVCAYLKSSPVWDVPAPAAQLQLVPPLQKEVSK